MNKISIHEAGLADLDAVTGLFDAYRQFYQQASDLDAARRFLRDRFEHGQSTIFLATLGDRAAGFTQLYPSFSSVSMRRMFILNDLYVSADCREHGVGRALLAAAEAYARALGAKELLLQTAIDNAEAQALYESTGWIRDQSFYVYERLLTQ